MYNDMRDAAHRLLAGLAEQRQTTVRALYQDFGVGDDQQHAH